MVISASSSCLGQPREGMQSPSLSRFKTWVNAALSSLVWVTCLSRGAETRWPPKMPFQGIQPVISQIMNFLNLLHSFCFWRPFILPLNENGMVYRQIPLSWPASSQCQRWGQLQHHSLDTVAKDTRRLWTQGLSSKMKDWWKTSMWDRIEMRIWKKNQPNKTSTKIPFAPTHPAWSFQDCSPCSGFAGFPQPPELQSDGQIPQMWPTLPFDGMGSVWQELFYWGQNCLQINPGFWKWAKLELCSCLAVSAFAHGLHMDYREAVSINYFSVSLPQLAGMFVGRCCRGMLISGDPTKTGRGRRRPASGAALAAKIRLSYLRVYLVLKESKNLKKIDALKAKILTVGNNEIQSFKGKKCNNLARPCFNAVLNHLLGK